VPVLPVSLIDPIWEQFAVLLPDRPVVHPDHPLGCHRHRIPDRVVFDHVVAALVHGSGYERIATPACSDRTIRRRVREWAAAGLAEALHELVLDQYDRMIGLEENTRTACRSAAGRAHCAPRRPRSRASRQALGDRTHPRVDEHLRPTASVSRSPRNDRQVLRLPRSGDRHHAMPDHRSADTLPLVDSTNYASAQVMPNAGRSK
jgi:transposase